MNSWKRAFEKLHCKYLYQWRNRGLSLTKDLRAELRDFIPQTIFDVGANVGQSARRMLWDYPKSEIHCFEPCNETFGVLNSRLRRHVSRVRLYNIALSDFVGESHLSIATSPDRFHLAEASSQSTETVSVETLDSFCNNKGIERVDLLKIDTEGGDLKVLQGATQLFDREAIDIVQVECGMHSSNTIHVPFDLFRDFFAPREFSLYRLYDQIPDWPSGSPLLRRVDAVFMSHRIAALNRLPTPW